MFGMFIEFRLGYYLNLRRPTSQVSFTTNNRNNISYLLNPGGRGWWEHQKHWLGDPEDEFVKHVDRELARYDKADSVEDS